MKKLKVLICALFVLCGGLVFSACGKSEFQTGKITVGDKEFVYNGNSQAYEVEYDGVDADVTYSFSKDKDSFKSIEAMDITNAGTYELYYKLSAKGYKDYISSETVSMTIKKADFVVDLTDYNLIKSLVNKNGGWSVDSVLNNVEEANVNCITTGAIGTDNVNFEIVIGNEKTETNKEFDLDTIEHGEEYLLDCTISNPNYNLVKTQSSDEPTINIVDFVKINGTDGKLKSYHGTLAEAVESAEEGETIVLTTDVEVDSMVNIDKSIAIDGSNVHTLLVSTGFMHSVYVKKDIASLFNVTSSSATLTLKDLAINCSNRARAVSAFAGKVVVDNATIFNGKKTDKFRSGGVYITANASFEMKSGSITGSDANDAEYTKYCADLWVGANALGSVVSLTGGIVGSVFVNSNEFSQTGAGKFVLNGGNIENVFVEYDSGYGAQFDYITGEVDNLMIALKNSNNHYGEFVKTELVEGRTYFGGKLVYEEDDYNVEGETFVTDIDSVLENDKKYIFENCNFNSEVTITKRVDITFNNCTFNTSGTTSKFNLDVTCAKNLVVANCTFTGNANSVYAIDVNIHTVNCQDIIISNCVFNLPSDNNVAVAIKQRKGLHDNPNHNDYPWAETAEEGHIIGVVKFVGNVMNENTNIFIGDIPQGEYSTAPNETTGAFHVIVENNKESMIVHNKFEDRKDTLETSVINLEEKGTYDSSIEE